MGDERRIEVHPMGRGVWLEMLTDDHDQYLDAGEAERLALEILAIVDERRGWFSAIRNGLRFRVIEEDELVTIVFEDGFTVDRYACPRGVIFDRSHFRADGSCYCPDADK